MSQPKTQNSVRTLAIPQQAADLLIEEHRKHLGNPYMFLSPKTGAMYDPDSFRHTHDKILKAIGAEHIRFHDLRHPYVKHTTKKYNSEKQKTQTTNLSADSLGFLFLLFIL